MTADGKFFIDGNSYELERSRDKVSALLALVGKAAHEAILVSPGGVEHTRPDELVDITPGVQFYTKKRDDTRKPVKEPVHYAVNGEKSITTENPLPLESILRNAGAGAAIDVSDLKDYYLENTATGRKYEKLDELVKIFDGDNFLAIHAGSTPVA